MLWTWVTLPTAAKRYTCHTSPEQPHRFTTFDGHSLEFDGDCKYLLAELPPGVKAEAETPPFQVLVKKEKGSSNVAYVEVVVGNQDANISVRIHRDNVIVVSTQFIPILTWESQAKICYINKLIFIILKFINSTKENIFLPLWILRKWVHVSTFKDITCFV